MRKQLATAILAGVLSIANTQGAGAQFVQQYVGEVRLFAFNWCPTGWSQAAGALLPIAQNSALFSLLGTNFGGNGISTFGLPNLSNRAPYGQLANGMGQPFAAAYGNSQVTLTVGNLPAHTHQLYGTSASPNTNSPGTALLPTLPTAQHFFATGASANTAMASTAIAMIGSNIPVSTQSPALSMNWCTAVTGVYPSRQ